jgi:transcriptional antiterminator RfaH
MIPNPLFPGYIFAKFGAKELMHKVRFTRGVSNIVEFGNGPCAVDEEIISMLKSHIGHDGFIRMSEELKSGDQVVVSDGLLKNLSGIFVKNLPGSERVLILLNAISFQGNLVVARELVQRVA